MTGGFPQASATVNFKPPGNAGSRVQ